MRYVIFVAEEKLERMASERQRNLRLGLSGSKMQVIKIIGNRLVQRRKRGVHEEMVVASIGFFNSGRCYAHVDESEAYGQPTRHVSPIGRVDEINLGIGGGGMSAVTFGWGSVDNPNPDTLGHHGRRMRDVFVVSQ